MARAIGIDFGTTNSVVAVADETGVHSRTWPTAGGPVDTFRTALTFWREGRPPQTTLQHTAGPAAIARALSGLAEQRFIQSIKTHVASRVFTETRLFGTRFTIEDLVATFLRDLMGGAPAAPDPDGAAIVAGRPVVFAGEAPDEALALTRLADAYAGAGLGPVTFAYEPLGAAYWYARDLARDETVLVADFGGGTSDFSVMRFTRGGGRLEATPLAHSGVGVAGDAFDFRLVDHLVSPRLGKGTLYRSFGKRLPVPAYFHAALAQWHQLSWLNTPQTMRELRRLVPAADAPAMIEDLISVIELDLGFELYGAINAVKLELSGAERAHLSFARGGVSIEADVTRADFESWIAPDLDRIAGAVTAALEGADLREADIDAVFMTGGTSYVPAVRRLFADRFGPDRIHLGNAFQSVASGLALIAADRARSDAGEKLERRRKSG